MLLSYCEKAFSSQMTSFVSQKCAKMSHYKIKSPKVINNPNQILSSLSYHE